MTDKKSAQKELPKNVKQEPSVKSTNTQIVEKPTEIRGGPSGSVQTPQIGAMPATSTIAEVPKTQNRQSPEDLNFSEGSESDIPKTQRRKNGNYALVLAKVKALPDGKNLNFLVNTRPAAAGYMKYLTPLGYSVTTRAELVKVTGQDGAVTDETRIRVFVTKAKPEN